MRWMSRKDLRAERLEHGYYVFTWLPVFCYDINRWVWLEYVFCQGRRAVGVNINFPEQYRTAIPGDKTVYISKHEWEYLANVKEKE